MSTVTQDTLVRQEEIRKREKPLFEQYCAIVSKLNYCERWLAEYEFVLTSSHQAGFVTAATASQTALAQTAAPPEVRLGNNFEDIVLPEADAPAVSPETLEYPLLTPFPSARNPHLHKKYEEVKQCHITLLNTALKFLSEHQFPRWKMFAENLLVQIRNNKIAQDLFLTRLTTLLAKYEKDAAEHEIESTHSNPITYWYEGGKGKSEQEIAAQGKGIGVIILNNQRYAFGAMAQITFILQQLEIPCQIGENSVLLLGRNTQVVMKSLDLGLTQNYSSQNRDTHGLIESITISDDTIIHGAVIYFKIDPRHINNPNVQTALTHFITRLQAQGRYSLQSDTALCPMIILNQVLWNQDYPTLTALLKDASYQAALNHAVRDENGNSLLLQSLSRQPLDSKFRQELTSKMLLECIKIDCDLTVINSHAENILSQAVKYRLYGVIPALIAGLKRQLPADILKQWLSHSLETALFSGDINMVDLLLDMGAEPNTNAFGDSVNRDEVRDEVLPNAEDAFNRLAALSAFVDVVAPEMSAKGIAETPAQNNSASFFVPLDPLLERKKIVEDFGSESTRKLAEPENLLLKIQRGHARFAALLLGLNRMSPTTSIPEQVRPALVAFLKSHHTRITQAQLGFIQSRLSSEGSFLSRPRPWLAPFIAYLHNVHPDSSEHSAQCKRWQEDHNLLLLDRVMWHLTATSPVLSIPAIDLLNWLPSNTVVKAGWPAVLAPVIIVQAQSL